MPIYEYKCRVCGQRFDVEQSITDDALTTLEGCTEDPSGDHQLKKVFHAVGIAFKGEGFYRNDSRSGSAKTASSGDGSDAESSSDSKSSSSSTETADKPGTSSTGSSTGTKDTKESSNSSS